MIKLLILSSLSFFSPQDSIGVETINGKTFIIHKVTAGETLYGISKRYNVTVDQIIEQNPTADAGLEIDQILKVPYVPRQKTTTTITRNGTIHKVAEKETLFSISRQYGVTIDEIKQWNSLTDNTLSLGQELIIKKSGTEIKPIEKPTIMQSSAMTHVVAEKETLFSISRQYNVTVDQLRTWNALQGNDLKVGQTLYVAQPIYKNETVVQTKPEDTSVTIQTVPAKTETQVVLTEKPKTEVVPPKIIITEGIAGSDEIKENGVAELIEGTEGNRKYLALHRTAAVGTILKIRNEMNNREVFVRVIGKLPETAMTNNLIIKISKSAYDRLGAIDPRFRVEVTYYK